MAAGAGTDPAPGPEHRGTAGRRPGPGGCAMNAATLTADRDTDLGAARTTGTVVSANHLRKAYKNKVALDDTAFEIPAGRIVGLIGPNGAGKTTALKAMLGLIPFEGHMRDRKSKRLNSSH